MGAYGVGVGRASGAGRGPGGRASETVGPSETSTLGKQAGPMEALPEKYREAIKKYFSAMEEKNE
jgi:hypothetical protein